MENIKTPSIKGADNRAGGTAKERLLAAANELFYAEGVHTVGIDRVIERAGVAKASLYSAFGSKDELVRAYLDGRAESRRARVLERIGRHADPREALLSIFDLLGELAATPTYRGCAFVNASAEGPAGETKVSQVCEGHRAWMRGIWVDLAQKAGATKHERVGRRLQILYDGAMVAAAMDHDPNAAKEARAIAEQVLDAAGATAIPKKKKRLPKS